MIYQDVDIKTVCALAIGLPACVFQSDSYDSRVYEYENDLDGVLTFPPLYGRGVRWYVLLTYLLSDRIGCRGSTRISFAMM